MRCPAEQNGAFVQDVDYQPYGKASSTGVEPGSTLYSNAQWNGGDALAAFGLSQLGARLYDPAIGRFLSRDPLLIPRTAATTNPYAFAMNDPVNSSDPTGLDNCAGKPSDPGDGSQCVREGERGDYNPSHWTSLGSADIGFPLPDVVIGPFYDGPGGGTYPHSSNNGSRGLAQVSPGSESRAGLIAESYPDSVLDLLLNHPRWESFDKILQ